MCAANICACMILDETSIEYPCQSTCRTIHVTEFILGIYV